MSLMQSAQLQASQPASALRRAITRGWPELNSPAAWLVALILIIMPLIANGFFLIEIFGTTLILGIVALSLMFLAGYGGMVTRISATSQATGLLSSGQARVIARRTADAGWLA